MFEIQKQNHVLVFCETTGCISASKGSLWGLIALLLGTILVLGYLSELLKHGVKLEVVGVLHSFPVKNKEMSAC